MVGIFLRLTRAFPLIAVLIFLAFVLYFVLCFKFPSPKAKKIVIDVFFVITGGLSIFCALACLYAVADNSIFGLEIFASFLAVALIGLLITAICNHNFLKHYPQYKDKAMRAHVKTFFHKFTRKQ